MKRPAPTDEPAPESSSSTTTHTPKQPGKAPSGITVEPIHKDVEIATSKTIPRVTERRPIDDRQRSMSVLPIGVSYRYLTRRRLSRETSSQEIS
ncbi:hypothetical protein G6F43_009283 [Rhizopus delemar]|nr:hypothetical protein G6F43_009283 [Rhizopus delemar]